MKLAKHSYRPALVSWISSDTYSHALTLNTDRELTLTSVRKIFGLFCREVDRIIHGRNNVRNIPASTRFKAVAFPEHLDTNAHLHLAADLSPLTRLFSSDDRIKCHLESAWLKSTRGAGSLHMEPIIDAGWARYLVKDASRTDPVYFLSAQFHPH